MNKIRYGLFLLLLPVLAGQAADFHPPLKIVSATLYSQHADVLRQAQVEIKEAGEHRIWLAEPLFGTKDLGDVLVSGARVSSKTLRPNENTFISNEAEQVTAARLRLESSRRALEDNEKLAAAWAKRVEKPENNVEESKAMLSRLADDYKILIHRHLEAERALVRAKAIEEWEGNGDKLPLAVVLNVSVDEPGLVTIQWREQTEGVFWQPVMRLALDSENGKVTWQAEAAITQQSGIAFDNVQLHLGLTAPQDVEKPPFLPLTLRLGEERYSLQERALAALSLPAAAPQEQAAEPQIVSRGSFREVQLSGRYSLPSGSNQTVVSYGKGEADAKVYRAIYSWDKAESAIVMAEFTLPELTAFIPGKVRLYRDNALVAERVMSQAWRSGEAFSMSFGEDINFKVNLSYPHEYKDKNGLIVRENVMDYALNIEVDNHSGKAQETRVYALLPVAGEKDILVKPVWSQMPESRDAEGIKGIVYWQKKVENGETWTLNHGYSVSYPEGKHLIGL